MAFYFTITGHNLRYLADDWCEAARSLCIWKAHIYGAVALTQSLIRYDKWTGRSLESINEMPHWHLRRTIGNKKTAAAE